MSTLNLPAETTLNLETTSGQEILDVSVIMPCLNERATIGTCVTKALQTMQRLRVRGEVVVGDNGSTDGSQQIASALGARVISIEACGYGAALQGAMAAARGRFIVMGDSDDSYDFTQLGAFLDKLCEGYDLVVGNRFSGKILPGAMPSLHRYAGNPLLSGIGRLFFKSPIGDFHCGLRAFRRNSIEQLRLQMLGMEFASEMIVKATIFGLRLTEIPITLAPDGRRRAPHLRTWRDGWRHLRFLLLYSPRWLFLYPGALIFALGVLGGLCLLPGPRTIGSVTFDVDTLLFSAMAILVGFQSIIFAAFTEVFAVTRGLLPQDPLLARFFRHVNLETGLMVGVALLLGGGGMWVAGLRHWSIMHFGPLSPARELRIVIPGIVCLTLGFQIILSSFFLSVLGMGQQIANRSGDEHRG
jgi:glycosyltransferase involved in cell wall biosynthesis